MHDFKIGDKVVMNYNKYSSCPKGTIGVVTDQRETMINVYFEGLESCHRQFFPRRLLHYNESPKDTFFIEANKQYN